MARQPVQVHIYLYRKNGEQYEYAIFRRSDSSYCWQGICGGLEDSETLEDGARRELYEEAGIAGRFLLYRLECISYVPASVYGPKRQEIWGENVIVVPMHYFAMEFDGDVKLSFEHSEIKWLPFEEAYDLVYFDSQETALYELNERLIRGLL